MVYIERVQFSKALDANVPSASLREFLDGVIRVSGGYPWRFHPMHDVQLLALLSPSTLSPRPEKPSRDEAAQIVAELVQKLPAIHQLLSGLGVGNMSHVSITGEVSFDVREEGDARRFADYCFALFDGLPPHLKPLPQIQLWSDGETGVRCRIGVDRHRHRLIGHLEAFLLKEGASGSVKEALRNLTDHNLVDEGGQR